MPAFKIVLAYDGTDFVGWQRQAAGTSIQGLLEDALRAIDERDVAVAGAGRTDAGVHALGQVAAFTLVRPLPCDTIVRALNARLPDAVRVLSAAEIPASLHPRFDAHTKTYRYRIWNADVLPPFERRYAWHVPAALDVDAMRGAARQIEGTHDFAAFQSAGSDVATTVRTIFASRIADGGVRSDCGSRIDDRLRPDGGLRTDGGRRTQSPIAEPQSAIRSPHAALLEYEITGDGFLRHMVRTIVGTLVEIGRGRRSADWLPMVLESRARAAAGQTAPARGLFLVRIAYDDDPAVDGACG